MTVPLFEKGAGRCRKKGNLGVGVRGGPHQEEGAGPFLPSVSQGTGQLMTSFAPAAPGPGDGLEERLTFVPLCFMPVGLRLSRRPGGRAVRCCSPSLLGDQSPPRPHVLRGSLSLCEPVSWLGKSTSHGDQQTQDHP